MAYRVDETPSKSAIRFTDPNALREPEHREANEGFAALCQRAISSRKKLVVDVREVQFMTSAIIGALILINKAAKESRVDFRTVNVSPNAMEVFRITKVARVFQFGDDDDAGPDA